MLLLECAGKLLLRNSYWADEVLCLKWFDSTWRQQEEIIMNKPLRFAEAFSKKQRAAMTSDERSRLRKQYNDEYDAFYKKHTRKDFTRERCWVILSRNLQTGEICGEVENSFSMGWSNDRVRVIRPYLDARFQRDNKFTKAEYNAACAEYIANYEKRVREYNKAYGDNFDVFIARVGSKSCPISIDWDSFYSDKNKSKYDWRNLKFKLRSN